MSQTMINELRSITTFVHTAELGSLSKAAEAQQISPQAASKALGQLESYLGVRLFHRTTRSMSLTEEGQRFLEAAQPALLGLQQALTAARQTREEFAGPLRIVGPRSVVQTVIGPLLGEYCRRYPDVQPDIRLDDRVGNWVEERVDVGLRIGISPQEGLIARRLFPMQLIICAAPAYLRKYGVPLTLHDLALHRCSAFRHAGNGRRVELGAVLAGDVIGQLAGPTAAAHIRAGRLVPLLLEHMTQRLGLFLYYGSRAAQPARVRHFIDLAIASLADNRAYVLDQDELEQAHRTGMASLQATFIHTKWITKRSEGGY
ncbi:LysR substrate-binding domain-containing protein [Aeromonas hydrophila]|nr:LysR substrate-binding domain-containing protein [Aeromonas hydrophila]